MKMEAEELLYLLVIVAKYRHNARKIHQLLQHFGTAVEVYKNLPEIFTSAALLRAEEELRFVEQYNISILHYQDEHYPFRLLQCADAPPLLFVRGNVRMNEGKFVSIVGTRRPTERGKDLCRQLVTELAQKLDKITIVSGLAYGIDVMAHRAAIENEIPTIIVPGHGLDRIYPHLHRATAIEAMEKGGIVTEYTSGVNPDRQNFIYRNRIIAGLSDATVVVESQAKGGSLITAYAAMEYDREVFTFPGRPSDVNSQGCNQLIKQQRAQLIENAEDMIAALNWETQQKPIQRQIQDIPLNLDNEGFMLLTILRRYEDGCYLNTLINESEMDYTAVMSALMQMEIDGIVKALPGGLYQALK